MASERLPCEHRPFHTFEFSIAPFLDLYLGARLDQRDPCCAEADSTSPAFGPAVDGHAGVPRRRRYADGALAASRLEGVPAFSWWLGSMVRPEGREIVGERYDR